MSGIRRRSQDRDRRATKSHKARNILDDEANESQDEANSGAAGGFNGVAALGGTYVGVKFNVFSES
jgi:hypothetical protein